MDTDFGKELERGLNRDARNCLLVLVGLLVLAVALGAGLYHLLMAK